MKMHSLTIRNHDIMEVTEIENISEDEHLSEDELSEVEINMENY